MSRTAEERARERYPVDSPMGSMAREGFICGYRAGMEEAARVVERPEFRFIGGNKEAAAAIRERMES